MVDTVKWKEIGGAPSHYGRNQAPPLRMKGTPTSFRSTAAFKTKLDECFEEMWTHSGLGVANAVVSAGVLVNKPGMHSQGAAFDLDAIIWHATDDRPEVNFYAIDFPKTPVLYCAVGAILNRHFTHTLHYLYNAPHEDHFHIDTASAVRFSTKSRARVGFLQAALRYVHGNTLVLDSAWGSRTAGAIESTLARLGIAGDITTPAVWREFLLQTARIGFSSSVVAGPAEDPDRTTMLAPPVDLVPEEDHEKALGEQIRIPAFYVKRPRMEGEVVERIQRALDAAGMNPGPIDGFYGSLTKAAVIDLQQARNLQVDGIVGPETAKSLNIDLT